MIGFGAVLCGCLGVQGVCSYFLDDEIILYETVCYVAPWLYRGCTSGDIVYKQVGNRSQSPIK